MKKKAGIGKFFKNVFSKGKNIFKKEDQVGSDN